MVDDFKKKQEKNDYQCWEKIHQIITSPVYLGVRNPPKKRQNMAKNSRSIEKILNYFKYHWNKKEW